MPSIKYVSIAHFRGIESLYWYPSSGINCLIGSGDSGKSSILDAIDWCLSARHSISLSDADFHQLDVNSPIIIKVVLGNLEDHLLDIDRYADFLGGYDEANYEFHDEPVAGLMTTLTIRLQIGDDHQPLWSLVSERAEKQGHQRALSWSDRMLIAPIRIGSYAASQLGWKRGSLLNRMSDEKALAPDAMAEAARAARAAFGDAADGQLSDTLSKVEAAADVLGINYSDELTARLDARSISLSGGTLSVHDANGIPLSSLGLGSSRLLVAELQRQAGSAPFALIDEVEQGLEPHRIIQLLHSLGSKDEAPAAQVFMSTHSPAVLRELSAEQLFVLRKQEDEHEIVEAGNVSSVNGTLRTFPEAFLGTHVLVCEGATEVGYVRGLDLYYRKHNKTTFAACGGVTVDAGGVSKIYARALAFQAMGYHTAVLRDDDEQPSATDEKKFCDAGGLVFKWSEDYAIENEVFECLPGPTVKKLLDYAVSLHGQNKIHEHLRNANQGAVDWDNLNEKIDDNQELIGAAAKHGGWFKRIDWMETAARKFIGPALDDSGDDLSLVTADILQWPESSDE